jgi:Helix-turn-helix domain
MTKSIPANGAECKPNKYGAVYRDLWLLQLMADPLLTPRFLKVALVLAMHMNTRTGQTYPSRETIARLANVCKRTVDRAMNFFEDRGHLKRHTNFNAKLSRSMRCWPILKRTDRSTIRDRLVQKALDIAREVREGGGTAYDLAYALWIPDSNHWSRR